MDVVFGSSSKDKETIIYRNFEYIKERENRCGTTSWRCQKFQSMQCKARLVTSGDRVENSRLAERISTLSVEFQWYNHFRFGGHIVISGCRSI